MQEKRQQIFLNKPLKIYLSLAIGFTLLGGIVDTIDYILSGLSFLITLNAIFIVLICSSFLLLYFKKTRIKPASILFLYSTILTVIITNIYFLEIQYNNWQYNFLRDNLLFFIFATIASFISGTRHLVGLNFLYVIYTGILIYFSQDAYIMENAAFYIILLGGFSFAMHWFMKLLKKVLSENIELHHKVIEKNNLIRIRETERIKQELYQHIIKIEALESELTKLQSGEKNTLTKAKLNAREIEILTLISKGKTNKEMAEELFISINTIKYHTKNLYDKLEVNSRQEAKIKASKIQ